MKHGNKKNGFLLILCMLLSTLTFAQQRELTGTVKDNKGELLPGVSILVKNTFTGTATDMDGKYTLKVSTGDILVFSFIGYKSQTIVISDQKVLDVVLEDDVEQLQEVVVIGYGVAKKSDLTGSVTALKPDVKNKGVVLNAQDMIQGKIAGVNVTSTSGEPGAGTTIRIRGGSSLNASNDPLIVIDGIPMDNNKVGNKDRTNVLSTINPQDIESFNVLKDASATAIYGSRGSNGVIIITTKKGRIGQAPQLSYFGSATVSMKRKTLKVMNGNQFRALVESQFGKESDAYQMLGTANTDWQDEIYQTAFSHDHNLTVSGSVGKILPYRVALGYTNQEGILKTSDYDRYTASLNLNPSLLNDHLTFNLSAKGMYSEARLADTGAVGDAVDFDPTQDPYKFTSPALLAKLGDKMQATLNHFGGYFQWITGAGALGDDTWDFTKFSNATNNPIARLKLNDTQQKIKSFIGSAAIDYKVHGFEDLRLHATLGAEVAHGTEENVLPQSYSPNIYYGGTTDNSNLKRNLLLSSYVQYYHDFNDKLKNHFDIMAGYEWQHFFFRYSNSWVQMFPDTHPNKGTAYVNSVDKDKYENYLVSFFGRANYSMLDRYYLTFTLRNDGSSRFADHWALFPSAAFAWKVKEESFLKDIHVLSDLKLRFGWGKTGQQDVNDNYAWIAKYIKGVGDRNHYPAAGDHTIAKPDVINTDLKWETTTTTNIGLDWGICDQRLSGSIDWYYRKTTDLLNYAPLAALNGYKDKGWQNIGDLKNTGIEVSLSWKALQTKDWFWTLDYNFTYNKNEITNLSGVSDNGDPIKTGSNIDQSNQVLAHQVGYAANSFYVYQQVYDKNGKPIEGAVVDRDGNGQITEGDRYLYKSILAPITMGLSSRLEYKKWDLCFSLRAALDNYVWNNVAQSKRLTSPSAIYIQNQYLSNRTTNTLGWQSDEAHSKLTDHFVQNASFLKLDNITLGYSFSDLLKTGKWHGLSGRLYFTASNIMTITGYDGLDPEVESGIDNNFYPRPQSFILGLNLNF